MRTVLVRRAIACALVASVGAGGQPTVAPFWVCFEGGRIAIRMLENATVRNVQARPAVAFQIDFGHRYADLRGVVIRGTAHVYRPEEAPAEARMATAIAPSLDGTPSCS